MNSLIFYIWNFFLYFLLVKLFVDFLVNFFIIFSFWLMNLIFFVYFPFFEFRNLYSSIKILSVFSAFRNKKSFDSHEISHSQNSTLQVFRERSQSRTTIQDKTNKREPRFLKIEIFGTKS